MPSELHFTCYILNNKYNYLNLSLGMTIYQWKKNNGYVLESDTDIENILKNNIISLD